MRPSALALDQELMALLRTKLPEYMVPTAILHVDTLPLTANGKVDRPALVRRTAVRAAAPAATPPRDDLERELMALWCDVLAIRTVSVDENFFDAGGDSLAMVRLHRRVCSTFAREVSLVTLFRHPSVRALADCLRDAGEAASPMEAATRRAAQQRDARLNRLRARTR